MPARQHRPNVETVYQQTLKTSLYVVLVGQYIDEVTNVFLTTDQVREMYTANTVSPESVNGEYLHIYCWGDDGGEAYIKAAPLVQQAVEALETNKTFPFTQPLNILDWETGLARYNKYFATFGIKYINAKSHFVNAPAPKVKPCPKQAIYGVKKTIIELGQLAVKKAFGASMSFGAANVEEVNGSAYVIKKLGLDLKTVVTDIEISVRAGRSYQWDLYTFETYGQFIRQVGTMQYDLTEAQTKELEKAISDWWKGLGPLKAE